MPAPLFFRFYVTIFTIVPDKFCWTKQQGALARRQQDEQRVCHPRVGALLLEALGALKALLHEGELVLEWGGVSAGIGEGGRVSTDADEGAPQRRSGIEIMKMISDACDTNAAATADDDDDYDDDDEFRESNA
eukprot:1195871-Prorocentrum_minimum.AAC.9